MEVIHHGGKHTVTGSCHELRDSGQAVLIDCGLFQGLDLQDKKLQGEDTHPFDIEFETSHLNALLLTHTHIDHIGRLPWLLASDFNQPIYCTQATAELAPLMIEDGLKLQGLSHKQSKLILKKIHSLIDPKPYGEWFSIAPKQQNNGMDHHRPNTLYARFQPAGHILGSAYIEIKLSSQEIVVFSGDLGPSNTPLLPDPKPPQQADYLFIESTYGTSQHDDIATRSDRLKAIIDRSLLDGGVILIPAFSIGRTQELLFDIEHLIFKHQLSSDIPIILDSPMAEKVTRSYRRFKELWGQEAKQRLELKRHPLAFEQCITVDGHRMHKKIVNRLRSTGEPAIVVAASGMCQGGRIMNYLSALLPDKRTDVILAGYQAHGTLGRELQQGEKQVSIDNQHVEVKAQIHSMSGYSAHADKDDLNRFIEEITVPPKEVHLIHGDPNTQSEFAQALVGKEFKVV
ncbi:MBL fold metallo-hydrolase [Vibrio cyclitrophicus]|uniref:MBL fold metallo-hydrolase n=1 Tax=Vibrio cyclitrophicus TaxID=47951 RepID=UPI000C8195A6|nr:MBL fold metallo-hydrolase [Vibrio cyclitrophicus]PMF24821.1 MBL fold hydrolase [Vibrio cyclitrophicus]